MGESGWHPYTRVRSSAGERLVDIQEVAGSIPAVLTNKIRKEIIFSKYNEYGRPIGEVPPVLHAGDVVEYLDSISYFIGRKKINKKLPLQGIWDGEKVQFEYQKTVVRTNRWLTVVARRRSIKKLIWLFRQKRRKMKK